MKTQTQVELADAEAMAAAHPDSFFIQSITARSSVPVGGLVKIAAGNCERFWVIVTANKNGSYIGEVNNHLVCSDVHGLKLGDEVEFDARHIYDICQP